MTCAREVSLEIFMFVYGCLSFLGIQYGGWLIGAISDFLIFALNSLSMFGLSSLRKRSKNVWLAVNSWAFGGRGEHLISVCNELKSLLSRLAPQNDGNNFPTVICEVLTLGLFAVGLLNSSFDSTMGFPGEGPNPSSNWAKDRLSVATWNSRSLTRERFDYCKDLKYEKLALTELWNNAPKYADGTVSWTYGQPQKSPETDELLYPKDPAGGVGILLSQRASNMYLSHGSPCNRITWVRLKGTTVNIFVVAVYMPHRARVKPAQEDTLQSLSQLLRQVPKHD